MIQSDSVEVVVDATGVPEVGANISLEALNSKKHLVLLNVEVDITIGLVMHKLFTNAGLVYSGSAGDEPAATLELYEFAKQWDLRCSQGKNNPFFPEANPDTCKAEADSKTYECTYARCLPRRNKTMAEMNLLSNATGLLPDKVGMHGVEANLENVADKLNQNNKAACSITSESLNM